jgi:general secretion pathway protein K
MPARRRGRQRGVAVVTALLLTALSVTLVTGIFWQQQVLVRGMEGQRLQLQGKLIVRAAQDAARLTLLDAAAQANVTTLDGAWTAPLLEDRLDSYLGQDARPGGMGSGGRLAQRIVDAQSRFNLRNLAPGGKIDLFQVTAFSRLLAVLRLDTGLAYRVAEAVAGAQKGMDIQRLDDLRTIAGFSPAALERLREFVVVLPETTPVNVNTASPEVLTTVVNFSLQDARELTGRRRQAYFTGPSDFAFRLNDKETLEGVSYEVSSSYFLVDSTLTLARATLRMQGLIQRGAGKAGAALLWSRED